MNISRNKLLLNMAQKGVQKEINEISDLCNLKETMQNAGQDSDTENELLIQPSDLQIEMDENFEIGSFNKSSYINFNAYSLPLLGNETLDEILVDFNVQDSYIPITTSAEIHNPNDSPAKSIDCHPSRSNTPMPSDFILFGTESQELDPIPEDNVMSSFRPQITSPSILGPDTSATSSASGASSECSSPSSSVMSGRKRRKFTIDVTKKRRKCNKENWIDTKRKLLQNLGKKHLSRKGKEQKGKDMRPSCDNCKFKCDTKISEESRKQVFDLFWGLGNHVKQWEFIGKYTKRHMKRRITTDNESKRTQSVHYFLPLLLSENDSTVKVCKLMFKNTLSVSNQFIQSAMDKYDKTTGFCEEDRRGRHGKQTKLLTETVIQSVCDHVKSFQPVESHYTRKDTNKLYLDSSLNFSIMFKMYKTWAEENNLTDIVQTLRQYRDVVNSHMNVGFFIPKKDQCDQCTANKNNPPNESQEQITFAKHIQNKNVARSLKAEDKHHSTNSPANIGAATFDFQKILNSPHGEVNSFYYMRKLSIYNFTVFDMGLKKAICYMWDETTARRGSNEVDSCLFDYIKRKSQEGVKDIRLWSDNCGGQNRNRIVFAMYLYVATVFGVRICHRFLEKGHTQQEGDSVHALIERSSKNKVIYSPQEWYTCVRWCKTSDQPYEVVEINQNDILDFKSILNQYKWVKNEDGDKVKWNQVREIVVENSQPDKIFYKYDLNEKSALCIDCSKRTSRRVTQGNTLELRKAYGESLPITTAKYKDLMSLCQKNLIPPRYHDYYKNIKHTSAMSESEAADDLEREE
ncbi:hypothetical protein HF086_011610 [Spodoptera exigua]|uniref:DUF7869 domain-containing protein n=1 Tax=Spodoptera exigua TaxID=7107 RepID=A0A922MQU7_SPOEX|nr:hypothetical protein HF086_011610 [Spodoptera exigua]